MGGQIDQMSALSTIDLGLLYGPNGVTCNHGSITERASLING